MAVLPEKQQKILDFIKSQHADTGVFPSVREIAAHMDFKSTNTVDYHLRRMEAGGVIERGGRRARSFAGFAAPKAYTNGLINSADGLGKISEGTRSVLASAARASHASIPLLGRVAAGEPILAEQHVDDMVNFSNLFRCDDQTFALRVQGDSMMDAGIMNGDLVIVKQHTTVSNGEIGVAVINGEATVKRIYDEGTEWRLQPENSTMTDMIITKGSAEFSLAGKVIGVVRQL